MNEQDYKMYKSLIKIFDNANNWESRSEQVRTKIQLEIFRVLCELKDKIG